jgi:beta-lactamase class D
MHPIPHLKTCLSIGTRSTLLLLGLLIGAPGWARTDWVERADISAVFSELGVTGTMVIADERSGEHWVHNPDRAAMRFGPASTFKVPHALFALDAGLVTDEFQIFEWDGVERQIGAWNRDQGLRSSMRNSAVWVYQGFARALGEEREREYLESIDYGNADPGGGIDRFWLDGDLAISPIEQIEFLRRLYRNDLPFDAAHQYLVKDIMIVEAGPRWILRAKTGWQVRTNEQFGWWVGWIEYPEGPVFFAIHIDMPNGGADAPKRLAVSRSALERLDLWPSR